MYKQVYFRINTPSYYKAKYGVGFENQQAGEEFNNDVVSIFLKDGWIEKEKRSSGTCATVNKDKQELYLHPQQLSGIVLTENIPYIENLLQNGITFVYERVDIYEDVFDLTDEEYIGILESKRSEIEADILEICTTKRSDLYVTYFPVERLLQKYQLKRLNKYHNVYSSGMVDWEYVESIFNSLVEKKKILTANTKHGIGYRTNKKLLKKTA